MDRKRLVGLEQYLPTLDRIIKNETYMHTRGHGRLRLPKRSEPAFWLRWSGASIHRGGRGRHGAKRGENI